MKRRAFIAALAAAPAVASSVVTATTNGKYGFVDWNRWLALGLVGCAVLVDGRDVTARCRRFDDAEGWADCYIFRNGRPYLNDARDDVVRERLHGVITVARAGT